MTPDPDRQAVYYAERLTFEETLFQDQLLTEEFINLAARLFSHPWWVERSIPVPTINPTTGRDTSSYALLYHPHSAADEMDPALHIAPNQIDAHTLAHEAAHVAQYHIYPMALNPGIQSHGLHFRAVYLIVTSILLGYDASTALADNFSRHLPDHSWLPYAKDLEDVGGHGIYKRWCLARSLAAINDIKVPTSERGPIAL